MATTLQQSVGEILQVWTDWKNYHAPKNLIDNDHTAALLANYVGKHYGGIASRTSLDAAVAALGSQVLVPEPAPLTPQQQEIAAANKREARARQEYADSIKSRNLSCTEPLVEQRANTARTDALQKELKDLESQIASEINSYQRGNAFGSMDYTATESGQKHLRSIRDQHDRKTAESAKRALSAVRTEKRKLP